ncbi:glycosyl hydrolase [Pseudomassariella vexata]|uniref:Glycosyl hydrolase n=1 Tax=Pseudomassariella vexata TaxID=1141098 RepID=A0A1Y2D633_9PEZI|nr:glycosyl hydrolase [Pseudomassariella vexata]ORY54556.1 glycosyl hydrolase [Pseudomassariella vexata]
MSDPEPTFQNPIIRGFNPDPTICVVPATATKPTTYFLSTSTFDFFPGAAIYASTDLINWDLIGHALTRKSQLDLRTVEPGAGSWAGTLRYRSGEGKGGKGRWYLANGLFMRYRPRVDERIFPRGFYVYTDDIWDSNAWSDPIYFDNPGFDQDLFWDDSSSPSKVYLSTTVRLSHRPPNSPLKDFAIHISEIDLATGRTLTPPVVIRESPHGIAEGSHILRRGKYYYLFTAEGGTEARHQEWCFRSCEGPLGPWESQGKPLWYNGADDEVQRTGHADVFEDGEEEWWAVFLGVRPVKGEGGGYLEPQLGQSHFMVCRNVAYRTHDNCVGRETFLVKVDWVDDWPVFNDGKNVTLVTHGRNPAKQLLAQTKPDNIKWRADLDQSLLGLGWYQKNTPLKQCYTLTERPDFLRLYGNCYDLTWPEAPAMLLIKQSSYTESFHAKMEFGPSQPGYEAGVVLWWSQYSHATMGITLQELPNGDQVRTAICRKPTGHAGVMEETGCRLASTQKQGLVGVSMTTELHIETQPTGYKLSLRANDGVKLEVEFPASNLTVMPPVGGAFTGVMFGLYSFGKGEPVLDPADFSEIYVKEGRRTKETSLDRLGSRYEALHVGARSASAVPED